jgi:hypothetical protein
VGGDDPNRKRCRRALCERKRGDAERPEETEDRGVDRSWCLPPRLGEKETRSREPCAVKVARTVLRRGKSEDLPIPPKVTVGEPVVEKTESKQRGKLDSNGIRFVGCPNKSTRNSRVSSRVV